MSADSSPRRPTPPSDLVRPGDCVAERLAFAVVGGALRRVTDFATLAPEDRPAARCPLCDEPVLLKLGAVRVHHAAHRAGSGCPLGAAGGGETALHVNTKLHLASALREWIAALPPGDRAGAPLVARVRCAARWRDAATGRAARCTAVRDVPLASDWDEVRVEMSLSADAGPAAARPDVVLLRGGRPVAAVEVLVTHAVAMPAAVTLSDLEVPWAEVRAARRLYSTPGAWAFPAALPAIRTSVAGAGGGWRCPAHRARVAGSSPARSARWLARVVDVFEPGGRWRRDVFWFEAEVQRGRVIAVRLLHLLDDDVVAKCGGTGLDRARAASELHQAFVRWARARRREGALVDSPMPWTSARRIRARRDALTALVADYPPRYVYRDARWVPRPEWRGRTWASRSGGE